MKTSAKLTVAALLLGASLGCETPALPTGPQTADNTTPAEAKPAEEERPMVAGAPGEPLPEDEIPITDTPRPFHWRDPIKGRRTRRAGGYMGTTLAMKFKAEYELNVIVPIKQMLTVFEIENNRYPESNEEFMEKVVKINHIKLPELPEYAEYIYVPEQPEAGLQVRRKQSQSKVVEPASADATTTASTPDADAPAEQPTDETDEAAEPEPIYNIRERAAALGGPAPDIEEP